MNETGSSKRRWWIVALVAVVVIAVITATVLIVGHGSSAEAVSLESASKPGSDPFTASVAIGPAADFPANVKAIVASTRKSLPVDGKTNTLAATGTKPGLYGGSGDVHVCKPEQLVSYLQKNPTKAKAWAGVLGIQTGDIGQYVQSLTPVVLTSDTLVTNHGYKDGHATTLQSVLQAGTAVMVDATGTPRVKCNCGNPLTPPELIEPSNTTGEKWDGYTPHEVVVVHAGRKVSNLTLINIHTGESYEQPVGAGGGEFVALGLNNGGASTTISVSNDGTRWTTASVQPGRLQGIAWGDDKWLVIRANTSGGDSRSQSGSTVLQSNDLKTWNQVTTLPDDLNDLAFANGRWVAVGSVHVVPTSGDDMAGEFPPLAVYTSSDGTQWKRTTTLDHGPPLTSVAYNGGTWLAVGNGIHQGGEPSIPFRSTDGLTWTQVQSTGLSNVTFGKLAYAAGKWAVAGLVAMPTGPNQGGIVATSGDGTSWSTSTAGLSGPLRGIAYGNGTWLAVGSGPDQYTPADGSGTTDVYASANANTWSKRAALAPDAMDLTFGGSGRAPSGPPTPGAPVGVAPTTTTTSTTTTAPPPPSGGTDLRSIDWRNWTYNDFVCGTGRPVKLTNGTWTDPSVPNCGMAFGSVDYADVTGDGVIDAVVNLDGNASGVVEGYMPMTVVFLSSPSGPVSAGYLPGQSFPPFAAGGIKTWTAYRGGNDPMCCPSQYLLTTYTYSPSARMFTKSGTSYAPASQLPKR